MPKMFDYTLIHTYEIIRVKNSAFMWFETSYWDPIGISFANGLFVAQRHKVCDLRNTDLTISSGYFDFCFEEVIRYRMTPVNPQTTSTWPLTKTPKDLVKKKKEFG